LWKYFITNTMCCPFVGRDLIGVQNLMKKHQALLAELAGHEPRIGTVYGQGEQMVKEGHFAGDEITRKIQELQDKWNNLKVTLVIYFAVISQNCWNVFYEL